MKPVAAPSADRHRARVVDELRRLLPKMEGAASIPMLPFGLPAVDAHLPNGGLVCGALHEIVPAGDSDTPAALGFAVALTSLLPPSGLVLFVTSPHGLSHYGALHGHGLNSMGLDPARVTLVDTADDRQACWAMEEALRSTVPVAVIGAIEGLDLRASQRLQFAAADAGRPLLLLRPADILGSSVAMTRWRIRAATSACDRFGYITGWRWGVRLERCRNGRPGEWFVEYDHAAHRFSLAAPLAHSSIHEGASRQGAGRRALRQAG